MPKHRFVHAGLNRAQAKAFRIRRDAQKLKWVIFSDLHRGHRDGADDFQVCEATYLTALRHYYNEGYTLVLLGDVEELWENRAPTVFHQYREVMDLERAFFEEDRLLRVWGNHDEDWRYKIPSRKHLNKSFPGIQVHEAIALDLTDGEASLGNLLLLHGHQGTLTSERWAWFSKIFVRYVWRNFQRVFKVPLSTPSQSIRMKSRHDYAMYEWASQKQQQMLICGHTHQPVFMSMTHKDRLIAQIENLKSNGKTDDALLHSLSSQLACMDIRATELQVDEERKKPCYFNTGCCSFSDGDITGLELSEGHLSLIKWKAEKDQKVALERERLDIILKGLAS